VPEFSRRARAFPLYAALRSLGRRGVADLVDRLCAHATRAAELLAAEDDVEVLHDVVFNQVALRLADDDSVTTAVVKRAQEDGTCWMSPSTWRGKAVMRLSFCQWQTTETDVERSVEAILAAFAAEREARVSS
jgi:glutamate/tyrosine decarboxylase-like PLP-dependent enzyme